MSGTSPFVFVSWDELSRLIADIVRREVGTSVEGLTPPPSPPSVASASPSLPPFATAAEVGNFVNLTPRSLRRLVLAGTFPLPVRVGKRAIRWKREDVERWSSDARRS